jgi:hypothetical protein
MSRPCRVHARLITRDVENVRREILASLHIVTADMEEDQDFIKIYRRCKPYTIASLQRMYAMWQAVHHSSKRGLPGDIVECGVWMDGNCMLAAMELLTRGDTQRYIWFYDTFEGMLPPSVKDIRHDGHDAAALWERQRMADHANTWWNAPVEVVRQIMILTGDSEDHLRLIKGCVEDTVPGSAPERADINIASVHRLVLLDATRDDAPVPQTHYGRNINTG